MTRKRLRREDKRHKPKALAEQAKKLRESVATGNVKMVRELISGGASVNQKDPNGWTLLHLAASRGQERALRVLLEEGGDPLVKDSVGGFTAMHYAAMHGRTRICRLLLDYEGLDSKKLVDARSDDGWTSLHVAAHYGREPFVKLLLESNAQVDALSDKGTTALQLAIIRERTNCVKVLLESGANIDVQFGFPLRYAVIKGNILCARILVEHGAKPSIRRLEDGQTPLHLAALRNNETLAKLLFTFGADVNVFNDEGLTPLGISQMMCNVNNTESGCVRFLTSATRNVRSLQDCCRLVIRQTLSRERLGDISNLPVPNHVKHFLNYKYNFL
ncbi:hypothetical protein QZH41_012894 [Actinostola sp. cb2023]|nr:hypothetical protein QZH41_012894 [Actinostola sp. cb2023]